MPNQREDRTPRSVRVGKSRQEPCALPVTLALFILSVKLNHLCAHPFFHEPLEFVGDDLQRLA